ncbi:hypothetical protein Droror1_Dr00025704 [Drosera rotundifolia]
MTATDEPSDSQLEVSSEVLVMLSKRFREFLKRNGRPSRDTPTPKDSKLSSYNYGRVGHLPLSNRVAKEMPE